MKLKGSQTEKNLLASFAGESQARNRYTYFASVAKKAGYEQIAAIFLETHQDPDNAPSDGPNMIHLNKLDELINQIVEIDNLVKNR